MHSTTGSECAHMHKVRKGAANIILRKVFYCMLCWALACPLLFICLIRFLLGVVLVMHVKVSLIAFGSHRNSLYSYFVFRDSKHASI